MKTRDECLKEIRRRMERQNLFFEDVWEHLLNTETALLNAIAESDFECDVIAAANRERRRRSAHEF